MPGQPPGWLLGPVWFVLYALLVAAYWFAFDAMTDGSDVAYRTALGWLTLANLLLNKPWIYLFFQLRRLRWALADLLLDGVNVATLSVLAVHDAWLLSDCSYPTCCGCSTRRISTRSGYAWTRRQRGTAAIKPSR